MYFSQFFSKKVKITKSLFMKNSRNNNIILGFSIWFQLIQWIDHWSWKNNNVEQIIAYSNWIWRLHGAWCFELRPGLLLNNKLLPFVAPIPLMDPSLCFEARVPLPSNKGVKYFLKSYSRLNRLLYLYDSLWNINSMINSK